MQPQDRDHKAEINALENQLRHYEKILDDLIEKNAVLGETKNIFHEVKLIAQKLVELKKSTESDSPDCKINRRGTTFPIVHDCKTSN